MSSEQTQRLSQRKSEKADWIPTNPSYDPNQPMQIGGQAVIEGVMMRAPGSVATAVRRRNGRISVRRESFRSLNEKYRLSKIPIVRGAIGLIDMLYLGIRTLNFSAEVAMLDVQAEEAKKNGGVKRKPAGQSRGAMILTLVVALALGLSLFFVLPLYATTYLFDVEETALSFNLIAGGIRIAILLGYLAGISLMRDIKRLFQYHGAEHKSVFAFELSEQLEVNQVRKYSRFHPRCGTSFLLIVMFVAILSFSLLDAFTMTLVDELTLPIRLVTHLPFVPIIGGLAYEFIKFSAKHSTTWWGRIAVAPGLWLQRVTTKEPDPSQIEVAVVALRCALGLDDASRYPIDLAKETPVLESSGVR